MASCHSSSTPKIERRIIEKNRRNHMKGLYSKLYSLLPNHSSKEAIPLPDQIDEAVNYIKSLQAKLEKSKKKKETLSSTRKRSHTYTNESNISTLKSPKIEIHEMGHALNVTLVTEHDDKFIFHEIIRLIHEDGVEVLSANFSVIGNSIFHSIHAKAGESAPNFIATQVSNRLKEFVNATMSDVEESLQPESWEFKVQPDLYDLEIPHIGYRCL